jgi:cysteine synthase
MATNIVAYAIASGEVSPSTIVVEASSGSTSIALSMVCATVAVPFRAYMPKTVSGERVLMIRRLGGPLSTSLAGGCWPWRWRPEVDTYMAGRASEY